MSSVTHAFPGGAKGTQETRLVGLRLPKYISIWKLESGQCGLCVDTCCQASKTVLLRSSSGTALFS